MTFRYFHLRSDGKTVTEISETAYRDIINRQLNSDSNAWLVCRISESGDAFFKQGIRSMWISRKHLEGILNVEK